MQLPRIRLPSGQEVAPEDWKRSPLWSTVEINDGAITSLRAFSYGKGGDVPGSVGPRKANESDTNYIGGGGTLPANQELFIFSIRCHFETIVSSVSNYQTGNDTGVPDPPAVSPFNILRLQRFTQLVLRIANTKAWTDHPVGFFPAGMGVHHVMGAADNAAGNPPFIGHNGGTCVYDNRRLATAYQVKGGEALEVGLEFPSGQVTGLNLGSDASARIRAKIYLECLRKDPVA